MATIFSDPQRPIGVILEFLRVALDVVSIWYLAERPLAPPRRGYYNTLKYMINFGAGDAIRTRDPNLGKVMLDEDRPHDRRHPLPNERYGAPFHGEVAGLRYRVVGWRTHIALR